MGALPKRRISTRRKGKRRISHAAPKTNLQTCPQCDHHKLSHRACPNCGNY